MGVWGGCYRGALRGAQEEVQPAESTLASGPSVSCFCAISKSSSFLTRMVRRSQAVLIGSMVSSCSGGFPMSGGKAQRSLLTPSQRQQPLTGATPKPSSSLCGPAPLLPSRSRECPGPLHGFPDGVCSAAHAAELTLAHQHVTHTKHGCTFGFPALE